MAQQRDRNDTTKQIIGERREAEMELGPGQAFALMCLGLVAPEQAFAGRWPGFRRTQAPGERSRVAVDPRAPASRTGTSLTSLLVSSTLAAPTVCGRCSGLMVAIGMNELTLERESGDLVGWRCVSCGEVLDSVILAHRVCQQTLGRGRRRPADSHVDRQRVRSRPGSLILAGR